MKITSGHHGFPKLGAEKVLEHSILGIPEGAAGPLYFSKYF